MPQLLIHRKPAVCGNGMSGYDKNGNVLNVTDSVIGSWSYQYDYLNRLGSATGASGSFNGQVTFPVAGASFGWGYDSFGNRLSQSSSVSGIPSALEQYLLQELVPDRSPPTQGLPNYIDKLARLGGYLARTHDPPPGNTVIWRGLSRLTDIQLGIRIGIELVGN